MKTHLERVFSSISRSNVLDFDILMSARVILRTEKKVSRLTITSQWAKLDRPVWFEWGCLYLGPENMENISLQEPRKRLRSCKAKFYAYLTNIL